MATSPRPKSLLLYSTLRSLSLDLTPLLILFLGQKHLEDWQRKHAAAHGIAAFAFAAAVPPVATAAAATAVALVTLQWNSPQEVELQKQCMWEHQTHKLAATATEPACLFERQNIGRVYCI